MNYLRNRPFLIVSYIYVPAAGQNTSAKNFGKTVEWDPIERVVIVDRVSDKQMRESEMIIDLLEMKVVKCRSEGEVGHDKLMQFFISRYASDIKTSLAKWIAINPDNLEKVRAFTERFGKKAEPEDKEVTDVESNSN